MARLRLGIILIIVSWLPIAQVSTFIAHNNDVLMSERASRELKLAVWTAQILIGFIGLWLVGKLAIAEVRQAGWRHTPRRMWRVFLHGSGG